MPLNAALIAFQASAAQCAALIANAHKTDAGGSPLLPALDQRQITVAAFLNLFVAWETFLEESLAHTMAGAVPLSGTSPVRYAVPPSPEHARRMVIGAQRFFDYGNLDFVRKLVGEYFANGYPFEPHLGSVISDANDLRTMRNASAHISSTTQAALEALAARVFGAPQPGIDLYAMLLRVHPKSPTGNTVFGHASDTLVTCAQLIVSG